MGPDGTGRTDPRTGTGAGGRTALRVEGSLAEMGILTVVQAHHQPWRAGDALREGPIDPAAHSRDRGGMEGDVETVGTTEGGQTSEVLKGCQIVVPGTPDPLAPAAA